MNSVNLFPAKLTHPDGQIVETARAVTVDVDGTLMVTVWAHVAGEGIVQVAAFDVEGLTSLGGRRFQAVDGSLIEPGRGCGCGHPLKRWRPPATMVTAR